jgi:hypothetical protein
MTFLETIWTATKCVACVWLFSVVAVGFGKWLYSEAVAFFRKSKAERVCGKGGAE